MPKTKKKQQTGTTSPPPVEQERVLYIIEGRDGLPTLAWTKSDHDRHDEIEVEFVAGGPFDGSRLFLSIVRETPHIFRVLPMRYEGPPKPKDQLGSQSSA